MRPWLGAAELVGLAVALADRAGHRHDQSRGSVEPAQRFGRVGSARRRGLALWTARARAVAVADLGLGLRPALIRSGRSAATVPCFDGARGRLSAASRSSRRRSSSRLVASCWIRSRFLARPWRSRARLSCVAMACVRKSDSRWISAVSWLRRRAQRRHRRRHQHSAAEPVDRTIAGRAAHAVRAGVDKPLPAPRARRRRERGPRRARAACRPTPCSASATSRARAPIARSCSCAAWAVEMLCLIALSSSAI